MAPRTTSRAAKEAAAAAAAAKAKTEGGAALATAAEPAASPAAAPPALTAISNTLTGSGMELDFKSGAITLQGAALEDLSVKHENGTPAFQAVWASDSPEPWPGLAQVAGDVFKERLRQVADEGLALERDDTYVGRELVGAAICYALQASSLPLHRVVFSWPLAPGTFKPTSPRTCLVKAAALILAEIERLDRAEAADAA